MMIYVVIGNGWTGVVGAFKDRKMAEEEKETYNWDASMRGSNERFYIKETELKEGF